MLRHLRCSARMILHIFTVFFAVACSWHAASSATFTVLTDAAVTQPKRLNTTAPLTLIRMTGAIQEGDSDNLREILAPLRSASRAAPGAPLAAIELSSNGGDVIGE